MSYWQGVLLGLVQGLTEFLPISSSGHLVVAEAGLGIRSPGVTLEVVLHVATILAVTVVYRARLLELVRGVLSGEPAARRYVGLIALASVPAGVVGVAFADFFERMFTSLLAVGVSFVVTGAVLWSTRPVLARAAEAVPGVAAAGGIGAAQALAILPGISRSGVTVAAAVWMGVEPVRAAEFSFLMSLPAIAGAALLQVPDLGAQATAVGVGPLVVSFLAAMASGIVAIRVLIAVLRRRAFHHFAPYCWLIGSATILWAVVR